MVVKKEIKGGVIITTGKRTEFGDRGGQRQLSETAREIARRQSRGIQTGKKIGEVTLTEKKGVVTATAPRPTLERLQLVKGGREVLREKTQVQPLRAGPPGLQQRETIRVPTITLRGKTAAQREREQALATGIFRSLREKQEQARLRRPKGLTVVPGTTREGFEPLFLSIDDPRFQPIGEAAKAERRKAEARTISARRKAKVEQLSQREKQLEVIKRTPFTGKIIEATEEIETLSKDRGRILGASKFFATPVLAPLDVITKGKVSKLLGEDIAKKDPSFERRRQEFKFARSRRGQELRTEESKLGKVVKRLDIAFEEARGRPFKKVGLGLASGALKFTQEQLIQKPFQTVAISQLIGPAFKVSGKVIGTGTGKVLSKVKFISPKRIKTISRVSPKLVGGAAIGGLFVSETGKGIARGETVAQAALKTTGEFGAFGLLAGAPSGIRRGVTRIKAIGKPATFKVKRLKGIEIADVKGVQKVKKAPGIRAIDEREISIATETTIRKFKKPPKVSDVFFARVKGKRLVRGKVSGVGAVEAREIEKLIQIRRAPKGKLKIKDVGFPEVRVGKTEVVPTRFELRVPKTTLPFAKPQVRITPVKPTVRKIIRPATLVEQTDIAITESGKLAQGILGKPVSAKEFVRIKGLKPFKIKGKLGKPSLEKELQSVLTRQQAEQAFLRERQIPEAKLGKFATPKVKFVRQPKKFVTTQFQRFPFVAVQERPVKGFVRRTKFEQEILKVKETEKFKEPTFITSTEFFSGRVVPKQKLPKDIQKILRRRPKPDKLVFVTEPVTATILTGRQLIKTKPKLPRVSDILEVTKVTVPRPSRVRDARFVLGTVPKLKTEPILETVPQLKPDIRFKQPVVREPIFDVAPPAVDVVRQPRVAPIQIRQPIQDITTTPELRTEIKPEFRPPTITEPLFDIPPPPRERIPGVPLGLPLLPSDFSVPKTFFRTKTRRKRRVTPTLIEAAFGDITVPPVAEVGPIFTGVEIFRLGKKKKKKKKSMKKSKKRKR